MSGSASPRDPILIVDDDLNTLSAIRITLQTEGFTNLVLCADSRDVAGLLETGTFSLLMLDLHMPHVSGNEIIRSLAGHRTPPIIVVTGSERFEDYLDGVTGEVFGYLVKPIDRRALVDAVRSAIDSGGDARRQRLSRDYLLNSRISEISVTTTPNDASGMAALLSQVRREYRRLLHELPTPYVVIEAGSWRIRFHNAAFADFLASGWKERAVPGCFLDLFDGPSREYLRTSMAVNGALTAAELRGRGAPDAFVIAASFRLNRADGYVEGGFVDITEQTRLRERLARAERLEVIGRLAGGLAHDLNNLLMVVGGFAAVLRDEPGLPARAVAAATEIASAVASGGNLVRRMLAPDLETESRSRIALHDALRESAAGLRLLLPVRCDLRLDLQAADPAIEASPMFVERILHNLVVNARDAMPQGGTITVSTSDGRMGPDDRAVVVLEVRDTGCGMDDAIRARIFEPCFTTKEPDKGSGFGLPTVRRLLDDVGGTIEVESAPGSGTLFRLGLPRAVAA